ncbi:MAG: PE-PPE domain-containing protein [Mycobacterium sp.]|nr:PE-PPE domain-containing protein [Mycobacterium sp.]
MSATLRSRSATGSQGEEEKTVMNSCMYVGRVGGLAFALGIGAAVLGGTAVAWADDDGPEARATASSSQPSAAAGPRARDSVKTTALREAKRASSPAPAAVKPAAAARPGATVRSAPRASAAVADTDLSAPTATAAAAATLPQPLILGPSGVPIPSTDYVNRVMQYFVSPSYPGGTQLPQTVFTPEGLYPITGVKSLPLDTSVDQGMTILSQTLALVEPDTPATVFGYSQSAIIGSLLQAGYVPPRSPYPPPEIPDTLQDSIEFIFVGNEMNPNGGFLSRFPDLQLPSLGLNFYGPTPEDAYPTTNYAREYDGFADFPRYPLNFLSVLNAGLGIVYVHPKYTPGPNCRTFCLTEEEVVAARLTPLPTTSPDQNYYFIPTENLPLLQPLRLLPLIGNPLADLIQPVLKVIVDLGYADPAHGFETAVQPMANVLTPFGLFPEVSPLEVLGDLVAGVGQGITDFIAAFGPQGSIVRELSAITLPPLPSFTLPGPGGVIPAVQQVITSVADGISASLASLYAALLPTADIVNAIAVALPAYNAALALEGVQQILTGDIIGGLITAIALPIAADVGLVTTATLVGALVWAQAVAGIFGLTIGA